MNREYLRMQKLAGIITEGQYNARLAEMELLEASIEQLKQQFVDGGKIQDEDFQNIIDASNKKSAYSTWLVKKVVDKIIKPEDVYKYKNYFSTFDRRKKEYPSSDINAYKTPNDVLQFIKKIY